MKCSKCKVGEVYAKQTGLKLAEETEYNIGWYQPKRGKRIMVSYDRVSHRGCMWKRVSRS